MAKTSVRDRCVRNGYGNPALFYVMKDKAGQDRGEDKNERREFTKPAAGGPGEEEGMPVLSFLRNIWDTNQRELNRLAPLVQRINELEPEFAPYTDDQLRAKTGEFRRRLQDGATLEELLPEACCREAAKRTLGQRHFDVQLMGGVILHEGKIAEMKTGEGKTLVATLPVYLNALTGKGVHVVTVNDYLAKRDSEWMGQIYKFLGLSVGVNLHDMNPAERREAYRADVTYGTNNEFGFDYLRDNMAITPEEMVQRELNYAIVDEVDSIHDGVV